MNTSDDDRTHDDGSASDDRPDEDEHPFSRRDFVRTYGVASALAVSGATLPAVALGEQGNEAELDELSRIWTDVLAELPNNWGKWGDDDEIGAHNYLGSAEAFDGLSAALQGGSSGIEVFPIQLSYSGDVITADDPAGDPVFPTRQPARRDNVVDFDDYESGAAEPLRGGGKFADDAFITRLFLQGSTQYDALAHFWYDKPVGDGTRKPLLYNGFPAETTATTEEFEEPIDGLRPPEGGDPFSTDLERVSVIETEGPTKDDIIHVAENGTVTRGVLLDVGRYKRDEPPYRLEPGECVTLDDLKRTAEAQGVEICKRDVPLVRTGSMERARDPDPEFTWLGDPDQPLEEPGLCFSQDLVEFIDEMEFPLVAADNLAVEKLTTVEIDVQEDLNRDVREAVDFAGRETLEIVNALHPPLLTNLGVTLGELFWLKDLAEQCAADGMYSFLYAASPLKIEHALGAPVNPVVVKATQASGD